eukprot:CAMPEP_0198119300 /NCGR_PEP_ID=MMETSP1442-20131203/25020_1 /TAXON_ID= /ORGANISM="Craspedostauros australis, Strain CCMP3328" /LENGTH=260 /DNA_ID=CAMNT_0043777735 /DNA_START=177 /DNA_END=959 /DNA_ORIENTATION=-
MCNHSTTLLLSTTEPWSSPARQKKRRLMILTNRPQRERESAKRVRFGAVDVLHPATSDASHDRLDTELKQSCWYSSDELEDCREDARFALEALHEPHAIDERITCIRGLEKYGDMMGRIMGQRRLVASILAQQANDRSAAAASSKQSPEEGLAAISRVLSQPSVQIAHYYAVQSYAQSRQGQQQCRDSSADPAPRTVSPSSVPRQTVGGEQQQQQKCLKRKFAATQTDPQHADAQGVAVVEDARSPVRRCTKQCRCSDDQ